jgi:hypothetical protein
MPPSGRWTGYYLYGYTEPKHRMRLNLTFAADGRIDGGGIDDIAPFVIRGRFDGATSQANWTKAYVGMHKVEYSGFYCHQSICGDWILGPLTGGFWIWPHPNPQAEFAEEEIGLERPVELV